MIIQMPKCALEVGGDAALAPPFLSSKAVLAGSHVEEVILGHRKRLQRIAAIRDLMLDELEAQTTCIDLLAEIVEVAREPKGAGTDRRSNLLERIVDLPSRIESLRKLTAIDEKVRQAQREAIGIEDTPTGETYPLASPLARIDRGVLSIVQDAPPDDHG